MFKKLFQKLFIKNAFGKYLDNKTIEKIINGENIDYNKPEEKECGYIIFEIKQNETFDSILINLLKYSEDKEFISDIYGTIIVFYLYRAPWNTKNDFNIKYSLNNFIHNLPQNILGNIRCVYGTETAKVGMYGTSNRMTYMPLINNYYEKLLEIDKIKYGEIKEINNNIL
jgi:hypothetical protein